MDAHGSVDVLAEATWSGVLLRGNERAEIAGASLNALLRALFIVLATDDVLPSAGFGSKEIVPGGTELWMDSLDHIFICLIKLCRLDDIIVRIETLFGNAMMSLSPRSKTSLRPQGPEYDLLALCGGALMFLMCLASHFSPYLSTVDITKLHFYGAALVQRCSDQPEFRLMRPLAQDFLAAASSSLSAGQLVGGQAQLCQTCFQAAAACSCSRANASLAPLHRALALQTDIPLSVGEWDPAAAVSSTDKLRAQLGGRDTKFKLEIFGGDQFLDEVSDEEDDDAADAVQVATQERRRKLMPRIPVGQSLTEDPAVFSKKLLQMDLLELARQWTLVDHALFQALSLSQVLAVTSSVNTAVAHPFEFLAGGTKRFIERFNIGSAWLTAHVLGKPTHQERAAEICRLVELAEHLLRLNNFHGLMSALSALQQGSIVRLQITFDHVPKDYIDRLNVLKAIMSGEKNQARYREELWKLMQICPLGAADWKQRLPNFSGPRPKPPTSPVDADHIPAVVPHLGAHVAALTAIAECHGDYLTDFAHLFNLTKWRLCLNAIEPVARLQRLHYPYIPLRQVVAALHIAWKPYHQKGAQGSNAAAKNFYAMSEGVEPTGMVQQYFAAKRKAEADAVAARVAAEAAAARKARLAEEGGAEGEGSGEEEEEEEEEESEAEDEEEEPKRRKMLNPFKLLRPLLGRRTKSQVA